MAGECSSAIFNIFTMPIPSRLFAKNRNNLASQLPPKSIAVFTANEPMPRNGDEFYPFRQQSDFFYLTGIDAENAFLLIAPDYPDECFREVLFIEPYDEVKATWQGEMLDATQAMEISGVKTVKGSDAFYSVLNDMAFSGYGDTIFLNSFEYPKYECAVETIQQRFVKKIKALYPMHNFGRTAPILNALRMVKSDDEIAIIQHACDITAMAFRRCLETVKPDMFEYQVQAEIEYIFKRNNATGHAYAPIIAGGKNACCLHYSKNQSKLNDGDLLLFDIGCEYQNYSSDLSRTIPINGKFSPRQKECYNIVLDVMKEITQLYRPGHCINEINQAARKAMGENSKYLIHGVSHHIGLDVHDSIDKFKPFEPGMILTCEPGIYICEEGIGIRIENDLLITEGEPINLFAGLPTEIEEIEAAMQR